MGEIMVYILGFGIIFGFPFLILFGLYKLIARYIDYKKASKGVSNTYNARTKKPIRMSEADVKAAEQRKMEAAVELEVAKRVKSLEPKASEIRVEKFCPNCGAPVNGNKPRCEYCESFLPGIAASIQKKKEMDMDKAIKTMENRHKERMKQLETEKEAKKREDKKAILGLIFAILVLILTFRLMALIF